MFFYKMLFLFLPMSLFGGALLVKADDLEDFRTAFLHTKISRETYMDQLVKLRYEYVWNGGHKGNSTIDEKISAINNEVKKHPLPPNSDGKSLSRLRVGEWESPRHDYLYRSNHTWTMLPIENDVTHGLWKIDGNKYYDWVPVYSPLRPVYTIILLDANYFVFTDGEHVFYEKRPKG